MQVLIKLELSIPIQSALRLIASPNLIFQQAYQSKTHFSSFVFEFTEMV